MNYAQAKAHYEQQANMLEPVLSAMILAVNAQEDAFLVTSKVGADSLSPLARVVRTGYGYASAAHSAALAYGTAVINVAGAQSRLGRDKRTEKVRALIMPTIRETEERLEVWTQRATELGVTLPEEREEVDNIAIGADAELRDIYRVHAANGIDTSTAQAHIADVADHFRISAEDLKQWRVSTGFRDLVG